MVFAAVTAKGAKGVAGAVRTVAAAAGATHDAGCEFLWHDPSQSGAERDFQGGVLAASVQAGVFP